MLPRALLRHGRKGRSFSEKPMTLPRDKASFPKADNVRQQTKTYRHTRKNYYHTKIYQRRDKHPPFANPLAWADTTAKSARLLSTQRDSFLTALCTHSAPTCQQIRNEKPAIYIFKRKNQKFCAANRPDTLHYATKLPHPPDTPPHPPRVFARQRRAPPQPRLFIAFLCVHSADFYSSIYIGFRSNPANRGAKHQHSFFHGVPNNIRTHAFPHAKKQYNTPT